MIDDQIHGLIFQVGDREGLLNALRWVLQQPESRAKLEQIAQSRTQDFSEEAMMQQYLEIWQSFTISGSPTFHDKQVGAG